MKRFLCVLVATLMCLVAITPVAANDIELTPLWDNARSVTASLHFSGSTGRVAVTITGESGVSNITADVELYYKNIFGLWVSANESWSYDVDQQYLYTNETFTGKSGCEYKIEMNGYVTKDGYAEPISATAIATCP